MNQKIDKKEKRPRAAAIQYDPQRDNAPCIVGLGEGEVARNMIKTAEEHDVAIVENPSLCDVLNKMSVGDEIPEELYDVVAEILVFISRLDDDRSQRYLAAKDK
ncbi:MAG: EscU/YscU/HrcU family type III secretion system export apparatus switch protein [Bacillota bacterium]